MATMAGHSVPPTTHTDPRERRTTDVSAAVRFASAWKGIAIAAAVPTVTGALALAVGWGVIQGKLLEHERRITTTEVKADASVIANIAVGVKLDAMAAGISRIDARLDVLTEKIGATQIDVAAIKAAKR